MRKRNGNTWERRERKKRRRMVLHGRETGKVYRNAVLKRANRTKGVTRVQENKREDVRPT